MPRQGCLLLGLGVLGLIETACCYSCFVPQLSGFSSPQLLGHKSTHPLRSPALSPSRAPWALRQPRIQEFAGGRVSALGAKKQEDPQKLKAPRPEDDPVRTFYPDADRVIAIGDVHGDAFALDASLLLAEVMDSKGDWIGGETIVVQMGDILDRGPDEADCISRLLDLKYQAQAAGGDVISLLGNHEIMNADLDFRYVEPLGWLGWDEHSGDSSISKAPGWDKIPQFMKNRIESLSLGEGNLALALAQMPVVITVGPSVFVHGGLVPEVVLYGLPKLNAETARWLKGEEDQKPSMLEHYRFHRLPASEEMSPVWHRDFGKLDGCDPDILAIADASMRLLGVKRMIIGHTPQVEGINYVSTADGREVWRVDTGMSAGIIEGKIECLEITKNPKTGAERVRVLGTEGKLPAEARCLAQQAAKASWASPPERVSGGSAADEGTKGAEGPEVTRGAKRTKGTRVEEEASSVKGAGGVRGAKRADAAEGAGVSSSSQGVKEPVRVRV